jgi:putative serine protease PepD
MTDMPPSGSVNDDAQQGPDDQEVPEPSEVIAPAGFGQVLAETEFEESVSGGTEELDEPQNEAQGDEQEEWILPAAQQVLTEVPVVAQAPMEPPVAASVETQTTPSADVPNAPTWVYQPPQGLPVTQAPDQSTQPSRGVRLAIIAGVISGLLSGIGGYTVASYNSWSPQGAITLPVEPGDSSARASNSIAGLAKAVLPTVVSIEVSSLEGSGTGSGFVIRSSATESYILTNNHVANGAGGNPSITVQFQDQSQNKATIVGANPSYDLAVLKVARGDLPVAQLGDSADVVVGDLTIAIGSPLGLSGTVTSGIVSALNRPVTAGGQGDASFINAIQTDAAINPGNSGGPLINASGQVIGVNSAIATLGNSSLGSQAGSIGLGFAIPMNQARRVAQEIINTGTSSHPVIGASLDASYNGIGARIASIVAGGPASKTSLKVGDVITAIDGQKVKDGSELIVRIRAREAGDVVTLTRKSGSDVRVTLKASVAE